MSNDFSKHREEILRDQEFDRTLIAKLRANGAYGNEIADRLGPKLQAATDKALADLVEIERIATLPVDQFIVVMQEREAARTTQGGLN